MSFAIGQEELSPAAAARLAERWSETRPAPYYAGSATLSRLLALILLICGSPLMLLTMLIVRLSSPGPVVYRQTRVGRGGRHFMMYKFRTMRQDAEVGTGPVWTTKNDPRITAAGRLIRALHLDEFPQLINVLKGEMALIGPRPERPEFTQQLALALPGYLDRLTVRPGITGLAQINLPPDTDLDSVRRKLVLDLLYVREGCLWLDFRIFACTAARLLAIKGPLVTRLFGLRRVPEDHVPAAADRQAGHVASFTLRPARDTHHAVEQEAWSLLDEATPLVARPSFPVEFLPVEAPAGSCLHAAHDAAAPRLPR